MYPREPSRKRAASSVVNSDSIRCTSCRTQKPLADFTKEGRPDHPFKTCKDCRVCSFTYFIVLPTNYSYRIGPKADGIINGWIRFLPFPVLSLRLPLLSMSEVLKRRLALTRWGLLSPRTPLLPLLLSLLMFLPQFLPLRRHGHLWYHKALSPIMENCVDAINAGEICLWLHLLGYQNSERWIHVMNAVYVFNSSFFINICWLPFSVACRHVVLQQKLLLLQ
jgi:hypothetical protein